MHQPLDDVGGLGPPGAAVGVDRGRVGEDAGDVAVDRRDVVLAGHQRAVEVGRHGRRESREIGAHRGRRVDAQAGDAAVRVERQFAVGRVVAAVGVGQVRLGTGRRPLDRPVELHRTEAHDRLVGVVVDLAAESAADLGCDDPHLVLWHAERGERHQQPVHVRVLARHVDRHLAGRRVVGGEHRAWLDRVRDQAVVAQVELHRVRGGGEGGVDRFAIADLPVEGDVAGGVLVDRGRAVIERGHDVGHRVERLVVDGDPFGGVAGEVAVLRHDDSHSIADVADRVGRDHRVSRSLQVWQQPADRDHAGNAGRRDVARREHGENAGKRLGGGGVDAADPGMSVRAANDRGMRHAGGLEVVGVLAAAGDERRVFPALDRGAEYPCHVSSSSPRRTSPLRRCCGSRCNGRCCP